MPLGQLNQTTEVENYPGFPFGNLGGYLDSAIAPSTRGIMPPHQGHGVSGPELLQLMRKQAENFGTRIVTDDIVDVDLSQHPFRLKALEGQQIEAFRSVIIATGAGELPGAGVGEQVQELRRLGLCRMRRSDAAIPRASAGGDRRR